jgi:cytochrome oxidase Cu insertion factor (SCO1/SenC/PrrC family)
MLARMSLGFVSLAAALSLSAFGCAASQTTATPAEFDGVASRLIPTSAVLGTSVAEMPLPDVGSGGASTPFVGPDDGTLVVYFGYTYCPDVCLTTLSEA